MALKAAADMLELMRLLHTHNYHGSVDPDHAVGITGDDDGRIGFAWEMGYMKRKVCCLGDGPKSRC